MKKVEKKTAIIASEKNPVLRLQAAPVPATLIGSKKLERIITKMKKALHAEDDGVAIAAPQIGESLRLFVVNGDFLSLVKGRKREGKEKPDNDLIFINPEIIKSSKTKKKMEEGCLSLRWYYGLVLRSEKVTMRALDEKGRPVERGASGLLAQIFQHEIDHLNGILFTDKAENLQNLPPKNHADSK